MICRPSFHMASKPNEFFSLKVLYKVERISRSFFNHEVVKWNLILLLFKIKQIREFRLLRNRPKKNAVGPTACSFLLCYKILSADTLKLNALT